VFDIPDLYQGCSQSPSVCKAMDAPVLHSFNKFVNASNQINVTCTTGMRADGLPDWVW